MQEKKKLETTKLYHFCLAYHRKEHLIVKLSSTVYLLLCCNSITDNVKCGMIMTDYKSRKEISTFHQLSPK